MASVDFAKKGGLQIMKPYILGAIFARGGSKGVPRKNIRKLAGKPLIAYSIEAGRAVSVIDKLIVSTDDEEIAEVAREYGAEAPFIRPSELAQDDSPILPSWKHAIRAVQEQFNIKVDILVTIPVTSPLRNTEDVEDCIEMLLESDADIAMTMTEASRNPYFNMVRLDEEGYIQPVIQTKLNITRRQQAPVVYDLTTVAYAAKASFVLSTDSLRKGRRKALLVPKERALDIDTEFDFKIAELLMEGTGTER